VPTAAERIATLEQIARENQRRLDDMDDQVDGVRARLHQLEAAAAAAVLRRATGLSLLKGWERAVLLAAALATAAAAWYSVLN